MRMAFNPRVFTIGGIISFVGSMLWKAQTSDWVHANLAPLASFLSSYAAIIQLFIIIGAVIVAFGLFWGRWGLAILFGVLFSLVVYVLTVL